MGEKLRQLIHYVGKVGLKLNSIKRNLVRFGVQSRQRVSQLSIDVVAIEKFDEFCYFDSIITKNGGAE